MFAEASTALFAAGSSDVHPGWIIIGAIMAGYGLWQLWMQTYRTDEWLRLREAQKKERNEKLQSAAKGAVWLAKLLLNKK